MYATEQGVLNGQWNAAELAFQAEAARMAPHVLMRPALYPDGDQWCALYGDDLATGCAGFGETPEKAMADFDKNWREEKPARVGHLRKNEIMARFDQFVGALRGTVGPALQSEAGGGRAAGGGGQVAEKVCELAAPNPLDLAWERINALGGYAAENDKYGCGINDTVSQALEILESLGGADPLRKAVASTAPEGRPYEACPVCHRAMHVVEDCADDRCPHMKEHQ